MGMSEGYEPEPFPNVIIIGIPMMKPK